MSSLFLSEDATQSPRDMDNRKIAYQMVSA